MSARARPWVALWVTLVLGSSARPHTAAESLDSLATVGLFGLTPGSADFARRVPFQLQVRSDTSVSGAVSHTLLIFPSVSLTPSHRYGLVVTRRVMANSGRAFQPTPFFE